MARANGLARIGARPSLGSYLREAWNRRAFAITLARYRIEAKNGQNRLGLAWVVLRPLINATVYGVVFGIVLASNTRPDNFIPFLVVGVFMFEFFSKSFSDGAKSITSNAQLVRSLSFPRILLPLSTVMQQILELIPMLLVMFIIVIVFGEPITWNWFILVPALLLMTMFNTGIALISARLTVHIRDVTQIIPFVTRIMFYTTGIFFSVEKVLADQPILLTIARLNPVHDYIALIRYAVVTGSPMDSIYWIAGSIGAFAFLIFGVIFFWHAEEQYGRD